MKSFKWHGIPVNVPNKKVEWVVLGLYVIISLLVLGMFRAFWWSWGTPP